MNKTPFKTSLIMYKNTLLVLVLFSVNALQGDSRDPLSKDPKIHQTLRVVNQTGETISVKPVVEGREIIISYSDVQPDKPITYTLNNTIRLNTLSLLIGQDKCNFHLGEGIKMSNKTITATVTADGKRRATLKITPEGETKILYEGSFRLTRI